MIEITPEHRLILGTRFPDWPILTEEQLELRETSLKEKDSGCVLCVGKRVHTRGFIYQFEWYQYVQGQGVQPSNLIPPDQDGYWDKGDGFRGCHLESIPYSYIEIPDPEAWMHNVGQEYSVAYTRGWSSDLEYAKAAAFHNFVVSLDTGFYHDMMFHIGTVRRDKYCRRSLQRAITFYEKDYPKSREIEYAMGYCADNNITFSRGTLNGIHGTLISDTLGVKHGAYKRIFGHFLRALDLQSPN